MALEFPRLTIGDALELADRSTDILDPDALGPFVEKFGKGIDEAGVSFKLVAADILDSFSQAPALAAARSFWDARNYEQEVAGDPGAPRKWSKAEEGESIPAKPLDGGETIVHLIHPIVVKYRVGAEDREELIDWLSFAPQKYRDIAQFLRTWMTGSPKATTEFIKLFARIVNVPEGYPFPDGKLTEASVRSIDMADGERIAALVTPGFIEVS